ncbi:alpha/beta hydrolase [Sphingomonas sp. RB3P16]|uniref:alpha/beta hydrolase n=1 Tax=Parasphingomonas frigoris TaxID=3096163 RepID=UPI002FC592C7
MRLATLAIATMLGCAAGAATAQSNGARIADASPIGAGVQAVGADSFAGVKVAFPDGVTGYPDLPYQTLPGYRPLKLDLFLPPASFAAAGPRPLVVYVHGGGWMAGGPRRSAAYVDWPKVLAALAAKGYVVASVSYRFSREAPFPAAIQDVKAGIRWLRAHAADYNIDPKRAAIWGQSAGGHLAALAGVSCNVAALEPGARIVPKAGNVETVASTAAGSDQASDCVQAVVGWFGIYDFAALAKRTSPPPGVPAGPSADDLFLGCPDGNCTAQQRAFASPVTYVDRSDPPFLLMHGSDDRTVPEAQTELFDAALRAKGVSVRKIVIPGVDHSWIGKTPEATRDASKLALHTAIDFINAQIGDAAKR